MSDPGDGTEHNARAMRVLADVLPRSVTVEPEGRRARINGVVVSLSWARHGHLGDVRRLVERDRPDVVAARHLSPGAREFLAESGVGWVDESGASEIAVGPLVVSRSGRARPAGPRRWTPAVTAVAEAVLAGTRATVDATRSATGLSTGSCVNALRFLTEQGLLEADAQRGRAASRRVADANALLATYADAVAHASEPASPLRVGVHGRDLVSAIARLGERWDQVGTDWAATGIAAAAVIAPHLGEVTTAEVYVDAANDAALHARAAEAGLEPMEGGRLVLRTVPTIAVTRLSERRNGLRIAPWPRVYADLRRVGVRGEEAAEHLREQVTDG